MNALRDALTSLYGQTTQDFAVLLLEHDVSDEVHGILSAILEEFPLDFQQKVSQIQVTGGGRARPLNVGLESANSAYVAALDDDDIVFANWVEEFKNGAIASPGRVVRTICAVQQVKFEDWSNGTPGFRAISWPDSPYVLDYSQIEHIKVNHSPFMSVAFPIGFFTVLGNRFDEELAVCEDWDMILRAGNVCGVSQKDKLTAIYRDWVGVQTSYTEHAKEQWRKSESRVIEKLNSAPFLLQEGAIEDLRKLAILMDTLQSQGIYALLFKNGRLRVPVTWFSRLISPAIRFAVKVRNLLRRFWGRFEK
jgi:glycosyltransferase involved in cell wall biosynthesis